MTLNSMRLFTIASDIVITGVTQDHVGSLPAMCPYMTQVWQPCLRRQLHTQCFQERDKYNLSFIVV